MSNPFDLVLPDFKDNLARAFAELGKMVFPTVVRYIVKDRLGVVSPVTADTYEITDTFVRFYLDDMETAVFFDPVGFWPEYAEEEEE